MGSTFFGLNIGQTGLYAYQSALDTTAHNITNTDTEGYTRQVMGQKAGKALQVNSTYGMAGAGVSVTGVTQMRDEYYDIKYWKNNTMFGEYDSKSYYMTEVENYFNEVSVEGFTTTFNSMFDSLQELQKNPSSNTVRTQVINYAKSFTEYFNSISSSLKSTQTDCNFEIRNKVDQINSTGQQIAALTKQINTLEVNGGSANDLRDQRALLVDELSEITNISVVEKKVGSGIGITSYVVKLDGQTLVDGGNYNSLRVVPRTVKQNQNDIDGLYDIVWQNEQSFNARSTTLGGSLQALFEVRDGNNAFNLNGMVNVMADDTEITMMDTNINEVEKLNIPETGSITVGNHVYNYTGFEVKKDEDTGNFIYTFELDGAVDADAENVTANVGESINYKGIPYYMAQMNEFIRTFSMAFNEIHRGGQDLSGNPGTDFFSATNKVNGRNYTFGPLEGSDDYDYYDFDYFNSQTGGFYEEIPDDQPLYGSYYFMTADNLTINSALLNDPARLAASKDVINGNEDNSIIDELIAMKDDKNLFKQGAPDGFFQTLVAEIGIDTSKASNFSEGQQNILSAIKNQRLSISGVDIDEEAMNLVRYQNAYNLSAKVITVMDEVYDKLINYMGV
jgi:flagellar hook-associated protein 1 FlgK